MSTFAGSKDIEVVVGRSLTAGEKVVVDLMSEAVSRWIRHHVPGIADDDPAAKLVVIDVIRGALEQGGWRGQTSFTISVGGRTESRAFDSGPGVLAITDYHRSLLGLNSSPSPRWYFGDESQANDH